MSSRNQNKPPAPSGPVNKNRAVDEAPLDKRRKIGTGRMMASTTASRGRQALAPMNTQKDVPVAPSETEVSECEIIEFTTDEVDVLLNEKFKGKKFDSKGKQDWMTEYIKKLKLCIKWFQKGLEDIVEEKENLHAMLDSSERKCLEAEAAMKCKEEELNLTISKLKDTLANEESQKLDALECHKIEKEARLALEKDQVSLKEEVARAEQNAITANDKAKTQEGMYKRLQEYNTSLQQYNSKLQNELNIANNANKQVEKEKASIFVELTTLRGRYDVLHKDLTSAKDSRDESVRQKENAVKEVEILRGELQQLREDRERQLSQIQELSSEILRYKESSGQTAAMCDSLSMKTIALEETNSAQREQISLLQHQLEAKNQKLKMADLSSSEYEDLKRHVKELQDELQEAKAQLFEGEKLRKKLHNTILELKGNIRVFCRVRPMLSDEASGADPTISYPTSIESAGREIDIVQNGQKTSFTFDKVFSHDASQEDVFMEISQLVQSALDGYKVCIFAYGQTGSGKTYTMMGKPDARLDKGLIPRSLEQIFNTSQEKAAQGWKYKMQASMLEIYNDTIRDLLRERSSTGVSLSIRQDSDGNTYVPDLTIINVSNINEVSHLLQQAARSRSVGKTDMNEESSRSHFVFTLKIVGVKESGNEQVEGVLNLIDLAGSERIAKSGVTGDRMTETRAINKSLTCLGNVFTALAAQKNKKEKGHVPFRDSKLTYLLQPCLGGDSKTLMFVNISPDPLSANESYNSLEFAKKVNGCEIGAPSRQTIRHINSQFRG